MSDHRSKQDHHQHDHHGGLRLSTPRIPIWFALDPGLGSGQREEIGIDPGSPRRGAHQPLVAPVTKGQRLVEDYWKGAQEILE